MNIANFCGGFWDFIKRNEESFLLLCVNSFFFMTFFLSGGFGFLVRLNRIGDIAAYSAIPFCTFIFIVCWRLSRKFEIEYASSKLFIIFTFFSIYVFLRIAVGSDGLRANDLLLHYGRLFIFIVTIICATVSIKSKRSWCMVYTSFFLCLYIYTKFLRQHTFTYGWDTRLGIFTWSEIEASALFYQLIAIYSLIALSKNPKPKPMAVLWHFLANVMCFLFCSCALCCNRTQRACVLFFCGACFSFCLVMRRLILGKVFSVCLLILLLLLSAKILNIVLAESHKSLLFSDRVKLHKEYGVLNKYSWTGLPILARTVRHHNAYASLIAWYGFPAFIIYLIGIGYFYWIIFKNRNNLNSASVSAVTYVTLLLLSHIGKGNYCAYPSLYFFLFYLEHYFQKKLYLSSKPSHELPTV